MRVMYSLVNDCVNNFISYCKENCNENGQIEIDSKDLFERSTVDVISNCAFGVTVDSLRDRKNEIYINSKEALSDGNWLDQFKFFVTSYMPKIMQMFNISLLPSNISDFFLKLITDTIEYRKKNSTYREDALQLLIQAVDGQLEINESDGPKPAYVKPKSNIKLTDIDIAANCFDFLAAGLETTATVLTFASYELAVNPDVQEKLHNEIIDIQSTVQGTEIKFDNLHKMEYLDAFISEVLRKHPPAYITDRVCNKETVVRDHNGQNVIIYEDTQVWINIIAMHHNEKYFPNPTKFDPNRFLRENHKKIIPNTYLPFGIGPRFCIGMFNFLFKRCHITFDLL